MTLPRKDLGIKEDLPQDISITSATGLQTAREDEKPEVIGHKFQGSPSDDCTACGLAYLNRKVHPLHLILRGA